MIFSSVCVFCVLNSMLSLQTRGATNRWSGGVGLPGPFLKIEKNGKKCPDYLGKKSSYFVNHGLNFSFEM